ncbi:MAG TPA: sigma-70 family RNA polymerase sigma factor [Terriglobales bacterium]|nr:sigma-70 family RNA polymerase sigma factor [Terriglobales bacterium]
MPVAKNTAPQGLVQELYSQSRAQEYGLSVAAFTRLLEAVTKSGSASEAVWRALKVEELALAHGCVAGNEHAWDVFLGRYREKLYDAARHITREESSARELADSLYAELFGTRTQDGHRISKLESYSGRGSLEGWLRTVLAQEWVNRFRKQRRLVSLEEREEAGAQFVANAPEEVAAMDPAVSAATDQALSELSAEDRYILAAYYLDDRTLAEVARTLGVHESTISRKVERLAHKLRKDILAQLVKGGMSRRQAEEAMEVDVRDLAVDVRKQLKKQAHGQGLPAPE